MFSCAACKKTEFIEFLKIDGHKLLLCNFCGLLVVNANRFEISNYIKKQYSHEYVDGYTRDIEKYNKRFRNHLSYIQKYMDKGKLLDIGCGIGFFLRYAHEHMTSWSFFGVEPNSALVKIANKNSGVVARSGSLDSIPFENNFFNVVTCLDVLEHSLDLHKNIREIRRVLKSNGLILVQAPNYKSFMAYITGKRWDWWCIPDHVLHFSYDFLTTFFETNGFRILKSYTYEDQEDFLSNIKGLFSRNYVTKVCYFLLVPLFLIIERIGWLTNRGGLSVVLAQKI